MSRFLKPACIAPIYGTDLWMLDEPLVYESELLAATVEIPAGFIYDGNSMPGWLRLIPIVSFFVEDKIAYPGAAALHDYGYRYGTWPREITDKLYREALEVERAGAFRRFCRYWGVRVGGWRCYYPKEESHADD